MSDWCDFAKRDPFHDGGSFTGGPPKGLLHTTEGSSYAGARSVYASKAVAPHFTASYEGGKFQVWQHVPISLASRALVNKSGGVQTNRDHVIQIEIVGFAADSRPWIPAFLDGLARLMRWIETHAGVPRRSTVEYPPYPSSYGVSNGVRLSGAAWDSYSGWLGHMHAPENSHGDPGAFPIAYVLGEGDDDMWTDEEKELLLNGARHAANVANVVTQWRGESPDTNPAAKDLFELVKEIHGRPAGNVTVDVSALAAKLVEQLGPTLANTLLTAMSERLKA